MSYEGPHPLPVKSGGTGVASTTAYAVLCGGTSSTSAVQSIAGVGTSGQVLTSNGAGALPTFQAAGGGGITTINGDTGSVTGSTITLNALTYNGSSAFVASGTTLYLRCTDASSNCILGGNTAYVYTGVANTGLGNLVLSGLGNGSKNCAFGDLAGGGISTGGENCCIGWNSLGNVGGGSYNIGIGNSAGSNYTGTEASNICINSLGTAAESHVLRIGAGSGTGNQQLNKAFISGIYGVTTTSSTTSTVLVSNGDQLGTVSSSERFKKDIKDMGNSSSPVLSLRPVIFKYKKHLDNAVNYGLIAEEVNELMPSLVNYDDEGKPFAVKYHDLPAILLNEIIKLNKRIEMLEKK